MPQHKVAESIGELSALRGGVKEDSVLNKGTALIEAALEGDQEAVIRIILEQVKAFQARHDEEVLEATRIGENLGKELLKHVG